MNKRILLATGALVLVAGGCYGLAAYRSQQALEAVLANISGSLGTGNTMTWASASAHPLWHSADIDGLVINAADGSTWRALHVHVVAGTGGGIERLRVRTITASQASDLVEVDSLDAHDIDTPGQPARDISGRLDARTTLSHLGIGSLSAQGIRIRVDNAGATLGRLDLLNYGIGHASTLDAADLGSQLDGLPGADRVAFGHFHLAGIDLATALATPGGGMGSIPNTALDAGLDHLVLSQGSQPAVSVNAMNVNRSHDLHGNVTESMDITGFDFTPHDQVSLARLHTAGLEHMSGNMELGIHYTAQGGVLDVSPLRLDIDRMADMGMSARFAHVDQAVMAGGITDLSDYMANPLLGGGVQALLAHVELVDASFGIHDLGLRQLALDQASKTIGVAPDIVIAATLGQIALIPALQGSPRGAAIVQAIQGFASHGGQLDIALKPDPAVNLGDVAALQGAPGDQAIVRLGVSASNLPAQDGEHAAQPTNQPTSQSTSQSTNPPVVPDVKPAPAPAGKQPPITSP